MKNNDREKLDNFIESLDKNDIEVPEVLEDRIVKRIEGTYPKKYKKIFHFRSIKIVAAIMVFLLIFVGSVKWIPGFAAHASKVPVIKYAVEWISGDSGIEYAREHEYGKIEGLAIEKDGFILLIDDVFIDEERLELTAIVTGDEMNKLLKKYREESRPYSHPQLVVSFWGFMESGATHSYHNDKNSLRLRAQRDFQEGELKSFLEENAGKINLSAQIYDHLDEKEKILLLSFDDLTIPFDKQEVKLSRDYTIDNEIEVDKANISFNNLSVSPTRLRLDISFDLEEGYSFRAFENFYLKDDQGNIYKEDGITITYLYPDKRSINIAPSFYFDQYPEKLYACFDGVWIGNDKENTFFISKGEKYPKEIKYMGEKIVIEDVNYTYGEIGDKGIELSLYHSPYLKIDGLNVDGMYAKKSSWSSDDPYRRIYNFSLRERKTEYLMQLDYSAYLFQERKEIELSIDLDH
ncbi:DUF4179 domain-containing protein [Natronospora cellulosivora (SeqCode)]